jgi:hypothetical protein
VVEVSVGAEAIPPDGSAVATMSVEVARHEGADFAANFPVLVVYPIDAFGASPSTDPASPLPGQPLPSPVAAGADPFAGCTPGVGCTRRFLVTFAWGGADASGVAQDATFDWSVTVRRVDLVRVWSTPAKLSARVTQRYDVAPGSAPASVHLEGDVTPVAQDPSTQVRVAVSTRSTSTDPLARLLPVPAALTYRAQAIPTPAAGANQSAVSIAPQAPADAASPIFRSFEDGQVTVVMNPMATQAVACHVGEACSDLAIDIRPDITAQSATGDLRFHWSLDLTVFSYTEVPVAVTATLR